MAERLGQAGLKGGESRRRLPLRGLLDGIAAWAAGKKRRWKSASSPHIHPLPPQVCSVLTSQVAGTDRPVGPEVVGVDVPTSGKLRMRPSSGDPRPKSQVKPYQPKGPVESPWIGVNSSVVGMAHLRSMPTVPCQDASFVQTHERPIAIVADGVGSARFSHIGADALVRFMPCYLTSQESILRQLLDTRTSDAGLKPELAAFATSLGSFASSVIAEVAGRMGHDPREFQSTLLVAVGGRTEFLVFQIGDGEIIMEDGVGLRVVSRGDVQAVAHGVAGVGMWDVPGVIKCSLVPSEDIRGVVCLTDGAAERFVSHDGTKIAGRIRDLLAALRQEELSPYDVHGVLADPANWNGTSGDDKSIAMLAR